MASKPQGVGHYQHTAFKHPSRTIRLCKFSSDGLEDHSDTVNLEIAHYTLDGLDQNDYSQSGYLDDEDLVYANFDKEDHNASFVTENGQRQHVKYTAISYCWGQNTDSRAIGLNGHTFDVSENLYQLLVVLRDARDTQSLYWIDQLCINQLDTNERNNQVRLMCFIYSSAEAVYVWLGNATATTNLGLRMIERLETGGNSSERMPREHVPQFSDQCLADEETEGLVAVKDLLTREYWTRLWIVQEVVYARKLFFLCGSHKYQFGRGSRKIDFRSWNHKITGTLEGNDAGSTWLKNDKTHGAGALSASYILPRTLSLLQDYLFMLECRQDGSTGYILSFDAVASHGWRQCRDPHDKIFGLESLVAPSRRVEVDYQKSTKEVFYEWIRETNPNQRRIPLDPELVQSTVRSLHMAMGLGDISEHDLNKLVGNPHQHVKQSEERTQAGSEPSRTGGLSSKRLGTKEGRRHILLAVAGVVCVFGVMIRHLCGAGVT